MFDLDMLITFIVMGLLFIRQVVIFKEPNKINYAPLLLGIGAIGTVLHLLLHPQPEDQMMLLRESLLPLFVGLVFFIIMNILNQTRQRDSHLAKEEFSESLLTHINALQSDISHLEEQMRGFSRSELNTRDELREVLKDEISSLTNIQENQQLFMSKFEAVLAKQHEALSSFEKFTQEQLPELDNVVHRHIDMLRIAEQDHFNRVKAALEGAKENRLDIVKDVQQIKSGIETLHGSYKEVSSRIVAESQNRLHELLGSFSGQLNTLRLQSEGLSTSLHEDESVLKSLKEQSELIMKQTILSAKQMDEMLNEGDRVRELFAPLTKLVDQVSNVHSDYVSAKVKLDRLADVLHNAEAVQLDHLKQEIESLSQSLTEQIDASLHKLHEHYHIAHKDISSTVQELSAKARMQKGYPVDNANI